jgi:hypothetical protein
MVHRTGYGRSRIAAHGATFAVLMSLSPGVTLELRAQVALPSGCLDIGMEFQGMLPQGIPLGKCVQAQGPVPPGEALLLELSPLSPADAADGNILYAKWTPGPISPLEYDAISARPFDPVQQLILPSNLAQGQVQVLVLGAVSTDGQNSVRLRADVLPVATRDAPMVPNTAAHRGTVTTTVHGAGFTAETVFALEHESGAGTIAGEPPVLLSGERAEVTFDVDGRTDGIYHLVVEKDANPPFLAPTAFELTSTTLGPQLEVEIEGRETFRRHRIRQVYLLYRNAGDEEMPAVSLEVSVAGPTDSHLRALGDDDGDFTRETLELLAAHPEGPVGLLPPDENWTRVPLVFRAESTGTVVFEVLRLDTGEAVAAFEGRIVAALDPNEKEGPAGTGDGGDLMPAGAQFRYAICFENVPRDDGIKFSAPVQQASVVDALDGFLDFRTLQFVDLTIGTATPIDMRGELLWFATPEMTRGEISRLTEIQNGVGTYPVRVSAAVVIDELADPPSATVAWDFETLGSVGDLGGFLPPTSTNDSGTALEGQGEGSVAFTVHSLEPVARETIIDNEALIFFDDEAGISTSRIRRRILLAPSVPSSPVPADELDPAIALLGPGGPLVLSWAAEGANRYSVKIWDAADQSLVEATETSGPTYRPTTLEPGASYLWQVVAHNELHGTEGPLWTFRLTSGGGRFVRGDANADAIISLTDAVVVLNFLFNGQAPPSCLDAADADDRERDALTLTDAVYILNWLFQGDSRPPSPSPRTAEYDLGDCGTDPTADELGCAAFAPCSGG